MHLKSSLVAITLVIATLTVLWLGKMLPKLIAMHGQGALILTGYLLVTLTCTWVLSISTETGLYSIFGEWRWSWILWGLLLGPILFVVSGIGYAVSARLGLSPPDEARMASAFQGLTILILVVLVLNLAVLEEWLFRGVVIDYLRPQSTVLAVIGSALVFALYHLSTFQLLPTFLLGLGLAIIVLYFGAVWPAVVAHALFNVIGVLLAMTEQYRSGAG